MSRVACVEGLGRAPATALAYMVWFRGFSLEDAFAKLRAARPCNPRLQAIRQATCDILVDGSRRVPISIAVSRLGVADTVQVPPVPRAPLCGLIDVPLQSSGRICV